MTRHMPHILGLALMLILAACDDRPEEKQAAPGKTPEPEAVESLVITRTGFAALPGWEGVDHSAALEALARSCKRFALMPADKAIGTEAVPLVAADFAEACEALDRAGPDFFETHFTPFSARSSLNGADGLFTGYFEAELTGALTPGPSYRHPLYGRPDDLVTVDLGQFSEDLKGRSLVGQVSGGKVKPYPERGQIDAGLLAEKGLELAWLSDPVDAFLLQVQGSGRVLLPDGGVMRVGFAAHNGRPYKSIGRALIDRGELKPHQASWDGIRDWILAHPEKAAALFAVNPRYVFFRVLEGDGPIGSQGVALTPERSIAVDRRFVPMGLPVWLDTVQPGGSTDPLQTLLIAQDTGGAIKGPVRGDFFWGYGPKALAKAGRMKSRGRYYLLLPNPAVARLPLG